MSSEDTGDSSSQGIDSPHSSPSQRVPHLNNFTMGLTCGDNAMDTGCDQLRPLLNITEQPSDHFRFRYISELVGTHGCVVGKSSNVNRIKTYPSVELQNYTGKAIIKCRLAQFDNDMDHPHQLVEDQEEDVKAEVGPEKGYRVSFQGMCIIHMAKKGVAMALYKKNCESSKTINKLKLKQECEINARKINLNIVRLKFSAHHIDTDEMICPPVFSEPIHNLKSAATNDLKISRMSRSKGKVDGSEEIFILTDKINKKNIQVRFVEIDNYGETCWTGYGRFTLSDVHHQYAIVCCIPRYKTLDITSDVKVYVELFRPSDGRTSERMEFTYIGDKVRQQRKKRKNPSDSYSSFGSSGGSLKSLEQDQIPKSVLFAQQLNHKEESVPMHNIIINMDTIPNVPHIPVQMESSNDLSEALLRNLTTTDCDIDLDGSRMDVSSLDATSTGPMLGQPNVPEFPQSQFNSGDIEKLLNVSNEVDMRAFYNDVTIIFDDYFGPHLSDGGTDFMGFLNQSVNLNPDSGRGNALNRQKPSSSQHDISYQSSSEGFVIPKTEDEQETDNKYTAFFSNDDGKEVKKIVQELCEIIRNKTEFKKQVVRDKLERLFELRLSNGDTFLHLTLHNNLLPSMEYIVKLIHSLRMTHLLNEKNHRQQTILHQAIINDMPAVIPYLVAKGCDPMVKDEDGNNVIHYAVICQSCLGPLLDAIKFNNVSCDLNDVNNEKHTALHLAVIYQSESSASLLLKHGASVNARDQSGRTPLHLAAYDASLGPATAILARPDSRSEVDAIDGQGNTALQIVCGSQTTENTFALVELLLKTGADPLKSQQQNECAWRLARGNPQIRKLMKQYVPSLRDIVDEEIKSEPEDEFESADEGDAGLEAMSAYIHELADILDRAGSWRALAARLQCDSLLNWYEKTPSPTRTLLSQVKECQHEVTSVGLAKILRDMGEFEAANVILRYVDV